MISYDRLWVTMKKKGVSQYPLIRKYGISSGFLDRLRKNLDTSTHSLSLLCKILYCRIEDIIEYVPDEDVSPVYVTDDSTDAPLILAEDTTYSYKVAEGASDYGL